MTKQSQPVFGATNRKDKVDGIQRFASVIGLKDEFEQQYRELHANVWPSVLKRIERSNIRNYSIYTAVILGEKYLFSYFEYIGNDLENDLNAMALDVDTQRWWKETDICQIKLPNAMPNENWHSMEQVFYNK
jgi:L-rhamnose mutarotase